MKLYDNITNFYYNCKAFIDNLKWMLKAAWEFRCWDYQYNLDLFAKSLEMTGKCIKEHGNSLNSKKTSRRCYTAAGYLRKAYEHSEYEMKLFKVYSDTSGLKFGGNGIQHKYKFGKEYSNKQWEKMNKKREEISNYKQDLIWKYLHKYITQMWD